MNKLLDNQSYQLYIGDGDGVRFIRLFRECWDRIPANITRAIINHWNNDPIPNKLWREPLFELSDYWEQLAEYHPACVESCGYLMKFRASSFRKLPEKLAMFVIAHEIGHVLDWADGSEDARLNDHGNSNLREILSEESAHSHASSWGFDKCIRDRFVEIVSVSDNKKYAFDLACRLLSDK